MSPSEFLQTSFNIPRAPIAFLPIVYWSEGRESRLANNAAVRFLVLCASVRKGSAEVSLRNIGNGREFFGGIGWCLVFARREREMRAIQRGGRAVGLGAGISDNKELHSWRAE